MFHPSLLLSLALLALPSLASAAPYEAPEVYCHDMAEAAYQRAVALGDGLPDTSYNRVQANCLYQDFRAYLFTTPAVMLNELVAFDQDGESFDVEAGWN